MIPLTSEKVQGVLDDATFTATLCMARDGKHYFFSSVVVDGGAVGVPNKRWNSRKAAMDALAGIASARKPVSGKGSKAAAAAVAAAHQVSDGPEIIDLDAMFELHLNGVVAGSSTSHEAPHESLGDTAKPLADDKDSSST